MSPQEILDKIRDAAIEIGKPEIFFKGMIYMNSLSIRAGIGNEKSNYKSGTIVIGQTELGGTAERLVNVWIHEIGHHYTIGNYGEELRKIFESSSQDRIQFIFNQVLEAAIRMELRAELFGIVMGVGTSGYIPTNYVISYLGKNVPQWDFGQIDYNNVAKDLADSLKHDREIRNIFTPRAWDLISQARDPSRNWIRPEVHAGNTEDAHSPSADEIISALRDTGLLTDPFTEPSDRELLEPLEHWDVWWSNESRNDSSMVELFNTSETKKDLPNRAHSILVGDPRLQSDFLGYRPIFDSHSLIPGEDSRYNGEGFDATVSLAFAQLIQSMSSFRSASQSNPLLRPAFLSDQEIQASQSPPFSNRRRGGLGEVGP